MSDNRVFQAIRWRPLFGGKGREPQQLFSVPIGPEHPTEAEAWDYIGNLPPIPGTFSVQAVLPARPDPNWPANRPRRPASDRSDTPSYPPPSDILDNPEGLI